MDYVNLKKYKAYKNDIIILSLSRLVKRKGHFVVIDAMQHLIKKFSNVKYLSAVLVISCMKEI